MLLTVDIGNTSIKWALFMGRRLGQHGRAATPDSLVASIPRETIKAAAVSSVVPSLLKLVCDGLARRLDLQPRTAGTHFPVPIRNLCTPPEQVGTDRLLDALAAFDRVKGACVVVDVGSAVTVDAVDGKGAFLGGAIAPGPGLAAEALAGHTARIPLLAPEKPTKLIGDNTAEAVRSGVYWGTVGAVSYLVRRMRSRLPREAPVIATGGWQALIHEIHEVTAYDPFLTLRGLRLAFAVSQARKS